MLEQPTKENLSDQDKEILNVLAGRLTDLRDKLLESGELLAKLTRPGLQEAKRRFRHLIGPGHIERLVRAARGEFPKHLAVQCKTMRLDEFTRLKTSSKDILFDPNSQVIVATRSGEIVKSVLSLNLAELSRCFDPKYPGVVPVERQRQLLISEETVPVAVDGPEPESRLDISVVRGSRFLILTLDGTRYKVDAEKFRRAARFFK